MKVKFELGSIDKIGFFIMPETDFEAELISRVFQRNRGVDGFVKCGLTPADVQGLRVYSAWWDCDSSESTTTSSTNFPLTFEQARNKLLNRSFAKHIPEYVESMLKSFYDIIVKNFGR